MTNMDRQLARHNMAVQQIRTWNVFNDHVIELLETVPREDFVPEACQNLAYSDTQIPLGGDQRMMAPVVEGRMLQALNVQPTETVLEIGTGSGFITAMLAKSARHVHSVEINPALSAMAAENLEKQGIVNVTLAVGDASSGWSHYAPYDVIAVTGSLPILDERFQQHLKVGGRLFAIIGESPVMEAVLITRTSEIEWTHESLFETDIEPLQNAPTSEHFTL